MTWNGYGSRTQTIGDATAVNICEYQCSRWLSSRPFSSDKPTIPYPSQGLWNVKTLTPTTWSIPPEITVTRCFWKTNVKLRLEVMTVRWNEESSGILLFDMISENHLSNPFSRVRCLASIFWGVKLMFKVSQDWWCTIEGNFAKTMFSILRRYVNTTSLNIA